MVEWSVVIPVYNGGQVIERAMASVCGYLEGRCSYEVIIVDDGSTDSTTQKALEDAGRYPNLRLLRNGVNRGKGFSVAKGVQESRGRLVLYTDADLVYPIEDMERFKGRLEEGYDLAIGSRVHPASLYALHPRHFPYIYQRHLVGRVFIWTVQHLLGLMVSDTQCAFKVIKGEVAREIFRQVSIPTFAFEVEALVIARRQGYRIVELPVYYRYEGEPSSVRLARDSVVMLIDLWRIRARNRAGKYKA